MFRFFLKIHYFNLITSIYNKFLLLLDLVATASHAGNGGSNPPGITILRFQLRMAGQPSFAPKHSESKKNELINRALLYLDRVSSSRFSSGITRVRIPLGSPSFKGNPKWLPFLFPTYFSS